VAERRPAQTAGRCWREVENIRKSSKAPTASAISQLADGTTLLRFSIFSESGLKHRLGCLRRGGFFGSFLLDRQKK